MKRWREIVAEVAQGDLFPNRQTVGTENEVVMIARFDGSRAEASTQGQRVRTGEAPGCAADFDVERGGNHG